MTIDDTSPLTDEDLLLQVRTDGTRLDSPERPAESVDDLNSEKGDLEQEYYQSRPPGPATGDNPDYVQWLVEESMLGDAKAFAKQFTGQGSMWQNPFADPDPRAAIDKAPVWFAAYPISLITKAGHSFLGTMGDQDLWEAFQSIGITAIHTGPVKKAGGISGWDATPSVDGHFDRISTQFDDEFGTEDEFRAMCEVAAAHGGTIIDDIVPGHTGKGADFRLAEMGYKDYPGIYHMVEVPEVDWHLLPKVPRGRDSVNLDHETEDRLAKGGYIIGQLQRVIFYEPGIKDTNWSATAPVLGPDGKLHRWVYLHYFKEGQPSLNWLDPTFAGMRLVIGDALHSLGDLGSASSAARRERVPRRREEHRGRTRVVGGTPLSEAANQLIASMVRKVGGFTFQELNLTIDDIKNTAGARRRPLLRLHQPARLPARAGDGGHRVPAAHDEPRPRRGRRHGLPRARPAEPRRDDLRAGALRDAARRRHVHLPAAADLGGRPGHPDPRRAGRTADRRARSLQRDLHDQRDLVDDRVTHRRRAGVPRPQQSHRRRRRVDPPRTPAARHVQRLAAGRFRALGLGPRRRSPPRPQAGGRPDPRR